jgi:hypothetical protein
MGYSDFFFFLVLVWNHIVNVNALDHILFILTLCVLIENEKLTRYIWVTLSFAIGHTISMAAGRFFSYSTEIVEFLIPTTIILSAVVSWFKRSQPDFNKYHLFLIMIFGLIHGLGFSNAFEMMQPSNTNGFAASAGFTIGLELAQIAILGIFLLLAKLSVKYEIISYRLWQLAITLISAFGGIYLAFSRWPF